MPRIFSFAVISFLITVNSLNAEMKCGVSVANYSAKQIMGWIDGQVARGPDERRAGTAAGLANEDYLQSVLEGFGLSVRREPIGVQVWEPQTVRFQENSRDGQSIPCSPVPYCKFTPPEGITAPLYYANPHSLFELESTGGLRRALTGRDVRGKIVVTEIEFPAINSKMLKKLGFGQYAPHGELKVNHPATWVRMGWHIYRMAQAQGAAGFVGILKNQPGGLHEMWAPYGFREKDILDKTVPGVWIGSDEGKRLLPAAKAGAVGHLTILGNARPSVTHNLVAEIKGETDEVLVLHCHHDAPWGSPVEDASGVGVVLAVAKRLMDLQKRGIKLKRTVKILLTAGHFYGSNGTRHHIANIENLDKHALEISVEHITRELEEVDGKLVAGRKPEPTAIFIAFNRQLQKIGLRSVTDADLDDSILLPAEGPLGNYPPTDGGDWHLTGVPVINFISNPVDLLDRSNARRTVDGDRLPKAAAAIEQIIFATDTVPIQELRQVDQRIWRFLMRGLGGIIWAKSTWFGLKRMH